MIAPRSETLAAPSAQSPAPAAGVRGPARAREIAGAPRAPRAPAAESGAAADAVSGLLAIDDLAGADAADRFDRYCAAIEPLAANGNYSAVCVILQTTPDAQLREMLIAAFAGVWGRHDPLAAAEWIASLPASPALARAMGEIFSTWAARDPRRAADFASALPPGKSRQEAATNLVRQWGAGDLAAPSEWLSRFPPHRDFDLAIASLVTDPRLITAAPHLAAEWSRRIADEHVRLGTLDQIAGRQSKP